MLHVGEQAVKAFTAAHAPMHIWQITLHNPACTRSEAAHRDWPGKRWHRLPRLDCLLEAIVTKAALADDVMRRKALENKVLELDSLPDMVPRI